jgi:hypothetical protein
VSPRSAYVTAIVVAATTALAQAAPGDGSAIQPHASAGGEVAGGGGALSAGFRGHAGADWAPRGDGVRPTLGVGATLGFSELSIDDPRALDGTVAVGLLDYGPEVQLGLRWADGGLVDARVFVSAAYLITDLDDRLMLDPIAGVGGTRGWRATIGGNWGDPMWRSGRERDGGVDDDDDDAAWLVYLLPSQAELGWIRSGGSDRFGVTLAWGF